MEVCSQQSNRMECLKCGSTIKVRHCDEKYCNNECAREDYYRRGKTFRNIRIDSKENIKSLEDPSVIPDEKILGRILLNVEKSANCLVYLSHCGAIFEHIPGPELQGALKHYVYSCTDFSSGYVFEAMVFFLFGRYLESESDQDATPESVNRNRLLFWYAYDLFSINIQKSMRDGNIIGAGADLDENERMILTGVFLYEGVIRFLQESKNSSPKVNLFVSDKKKSDVAASTPEDVLKKKLDNMKNRFYFKEDSTVRSIYFNFCEKIPGINTLLIFCRYKGLNEGEVVRNIRVVTLNSFSFQDLAIMPRTFANLDESNKFSSLNNTLPKCSYSVIHVKGGETGGKFQKVMPDQSLQSVFHNETNVKLRLVLRVGKTAWMKSLKSPIYLIVGNDKINWMISTHLNIKFKDIVDHMIANVQKMIDTDQNVTTNIDVNIQNKTIQEVLKEIGKTVVPKTSSDEYIEFIDLTKVNNYSVKFIDSTGKEIVLDEPKHPKMFQKAISLYDEIVEEGKKYSGGARIVMLFSWNDKNDIYRENIIANGVWEHSKGVSDGNKSSNYFGIRSMMEVHENEVGDSQLITKVYDDKGGANFDSGIDIWKIQMEEDGSEKKKLGDSIKFITSLMIDDGFTNDDSEESPVQNQNENTIDRTNTTTEATNADTEEQAGSVGDLFD